MNYIPPFSLTSEILTLIQKISYVLGWLEGQRLPIIPLKGRQENQIKTIHSSLKIEETF